MTVRVAAGLVEVTMPKSSSLGAKAMGLGCVVVAGRMAAWGGGVVGLDGEGAGIGGGAGEGDGALGAGGEGGGAVVGDGEAGGGESGDCWPRGCRDCGG